MANRLEEAVVSGAKEKVDLQMGIPRIYVFMQRAESMLVACAYAIELNPIDLEGRMLIVSTTPDVSWVQGFPMQAEWPQGLTAVVQLSGTYDMIPAADEDLQEGLKVLGMTID